MIQKNRTILKLNKPFAKFILLFIVLYSFFILSTRDCFSQPITWQRILNNNYGNLEKIQQTYDGGYIAAGTDRINNENKLYLVKFDYLGIYSWVKIIGVGPTHGYWIEETSDRGYILGASQDTNGNTVAYLVKTDSMGIILWSKTYSYSGLDQCYFVKQTFDNGYILSCRITPPVTDGVVFIKTDSVGIIQIQKIYHNINYHQYVSELEISSDGYLTVGYYSDFNNSDIYLMRLNNSLDTLWTKKIGGNNTDLGYSIDKINSHEYIIAGYSNSFHPNNGYQSYVCRIDSIGGIIWQRTYSNLGYDLCKSIRYKPGTGFIAVGKTDSLNNNVFKAKMRLIDMNGNVMYENSILPGTAGAGFESVELTSDNGFIAAGYAVLTGAFVKMFIVKTDSLLYAQPIGFVNIGNQMPKTFELYQNYPNPFNPETNIEFDVSRKSYVKIVIYDVLGREIESFDFGQLSSGGYQLKWNGRRQSSGVYFYTIYSEDFVRTKKMILLK